MTARVVVLGAGYAGARAVQRLEARLPDDADLLWVSLEDYHLVLHEVHRVISDADAADAVTVSVDDIKSPDTAFLEGRAVDVDTDAQTIEFAEANSVDYDYLLAALGSETAFFGVPGLRERAHTLKSLADARAIREDVVAAASDASESDPAHVVVGGAGLSGIQAAGELAELRDDRDLPVEIRLVEGLETILPDEPAAVREAVRDRLEVRDVDVVTGQFVGEVDDEYVHVDGEGRFPQDVVVWTGGIRGSGTLADAGIDADNRSARVFAGRDFTTSDDRVFALGDCALIEQAEADPAPPNAQAAWQAAEVAAENVVRAIRADPLSTWTYRDLGTVLSVGDSAVADGVRFGPLAPPFMPWTGVSAHLLKKAVGAKWIASVAGYRRALEAWSHL